MADDGMPWVLNLVGLMILVLMILGVYTIITLRSDAVECYADPVKCAADRIADQNQQNITLTITGQGKESIVYSTEAQSYLDFNK